MAPNPLSLLPNLRLALLASIVSLGAAFASQFLGGLTPCHLCVAQRVPYVVVIVLALLGLLRKRGLKGLTLLVVLAFLTGSGIAAYHAGVEKHWIAGPSSCTSGEAPAGQSMDDFLKRIQSAPIVACDQPQWEFHGLTMASMNMAWSFLLAAASFVALHQSRGRKPVGEGQHA